MGVAPQRLPGYEPLDNEQSRQRLQNLWGKNLPSDRGRSAEELLQSVSGLVVLADDPPAVVPMGKRALTAMERIEFLVVLDAFVTPTVRIAHAALPIANFAETEGTLTNMEGRVQKLRRAIDPAREARAGWQVLAELCARFGAGNSYATGTDVLSEIAQAVPQYATIEQRLSENGWGGALLGDSEEAESLVHPSGAKRMEVFPTSGRRHVLARDGAFDWGRDPFVVFSPTLSRDSQSEQKLFPKGYVEMSQADADALNLGMKRRVRLTSSHGEAVVPIRIQTDLKPGVLSVPYAFRDHLANVLGTGSVTAVDVQLP